MMGLYIVGIFVGECVALSGDRAVVSVDGEMMIMRR